MKRIMIAVMFLALTAPDVSADPDFINTFDRVFEHTGADATRLVAEVTETALNQDSGVAGRCITEPQKRGSAFF